MFIYHVIYIYIYIYIYKKQKTKGEKRDLKIPGLTKLPERGFRSAQKNPRAGTPQGGGFFHEAGKNPRAGENPGGGIAKKIPPPKDHTPFQH